MKRTARMLGLLPLLVYTSSLAYEINFKFMEGQPCHSGNVLSVSYNIDEDTLGIEFSGALDLYTRKSELHDRLMKAFFAHETVKIFAKSCAHGSYFDDASFVHTY